MDRTEFLKLLAEAKRVYPHQVSISSELSPDPRKFHKKYGGPFAVFPMESTRLWLFSSKKRVEWFISEFGGTQVDED